MQSVEFYQGHLDRVSRSFAFCIQKLEAPFRQWVSLSYLLCRALDTIEDSPWSGQELSGQKLQDQQYQLFESFLTEAPTEAQALAWAERFPDSIPESEKALNQDAYLLFQDLHELPAPVRSSIQETVRKMRRGMQYYSHRMQSGSLRLKDLVDVNRYCYFVAGVVGELLTETYLAWRPDFVVPADFRKNALHFGLFLQKINVLKDQRSDESEGRFFVPNRSELLSSLRENAQGALDYILALPESEPGYRTFCAWSLFLGAATIPFMEQNFANQDQTKISRAETLELLEAIEAIVTDNHALQAGFDRYLPLLPESLSSAREAALAEAHGRSVPARKPGSPEIPDIKDATWFRELSQGAVGPNEMIELGMA